MRTLLPLLLLVSCGRPEDPDTCGTLVLTGGDGLAIDSPGCASGTLTLSTQGTGDLSVTLEPVGDGEWRPVIEGSGVLTAVVLEGSVSLEGVGERAWWRQGYQSWSWSGVTEPQPIERDAQGLPEVGGDGDGFDVAHETAWSSWWVGLLGYDDGASLLVGATAAERSKWTLSTDGETLVAVWAGRGEQIQVDGRVELDPIWVGVDRDAWSLHVAYADAVAERTAPRPLRPRAPVGWATWTVYYEDIDADVVAAELAHAETVFASAPEPRLFQIDDGWQQVWGEWTAGPDFPDGTAALAASIEQAGFQPGLWMAPFYVDRSTTTYAAHDDWWVRNPDGTELRFTNLNTGDYAVIDATHPDARAWMAQQVADRVDDGFTYLKLDFLYAGAQEGLRQQDVTGTEALQLGLRAIREAVGDEAWILACGAPMLPSVGFAESFRSGADIAFTVQPDSDLDSLRWQTRATAARGWQTGVWWQIDSDQVLLREPFDESQGKAALIAAAASGGALLLGDSLADVPDWATNPALLEGLSAVPAVPEHPLASVSGIDASPIIENVQQDDRVPVRWQFPDGRTALINLSEDPLEVTAPPGTELFSGDALDEEAPRTLAPWSAELWLP